MSGTLLPRQVPCIGEYMTALVPHLLKMPLTRHPTRQVVVTSRKQMIIPTSHHQDLSSSTNPVHISLMFGISYVLPAQADLGLDHVVLSQRERGSQQGAFMIVL
ncbi:hypothetical protein J1605_019902 [Eschrichtius robustus]|uniref:Uncharacterized protein n=1 Tax=Eschrichtius robustus TaxID=9764 RepID=A0AB34HKY0_ESCRO|nr:hypothetical protein J1605_019902 [Eschrichtius robustus]